MARPWVRWLSRIGIAVVAVVSVGALLWAASFWSRVHDVWHWYRGAKSPSEAIAPIFTLAAGLAIAWIAWMRHFAQTEADRQRRITDSYSKAVDQLSNEKIEARLGGIYTLERISEESDKDYWTIMETLTAFVRERTRKMEADRLAKSSTERIAERAYVHWENAGRPEGRDEEFWRKSVEEEKIGEPTATDVEAVLTVIKRRSEHHRAIEARGKKVLDFRNAVLRRANLSQAHLERANLVGAALERANLIQAHLERAGLYEAHLEGAYLIEAHLEGASLSWAHLERAFLRIAHLEGAVLAEAHLEDADLRWAHLEGADLRGADGLTQGQIEAAYGDAATRLPAGLTRPAHWTAPGGANAG
jgi:hypothetical protein